MLLTARSGRGASLDTGAPLLLLRAVAHRVAELLRLLDSRRLDLRPDHVAHRRNPVGDDVPLLAVPLLDQDGAVALVVLTGNLDRVRKVLHADLLKVTCEDQDRKSTRLNSSHVAISYAVFCLKKKNHI